MRRSRIVAHERRVRDDERGVERSRGERDADAGALMEFEKNNAMLKAMDDMLEAMLKNVSDW